MKKRSLGNTGLEVSIAGFGGFHLVEVPSRETERLLHAYLERGGNYIETAAQYGSGVSEEKIGRAVSKRRSDFYLATKVLERRKGPAKKQIEESLRHLKTDHVDILFAHGIQTMDLLDEIMAEDGALQAIIEAKKEGKTRFIGITGHGRQPVILEAINRYPFDVYMTGYNYLDRFNYPINEETLLPDAEKKGIGILGMKALADGYLYRNYEQAIRYTLSLPIHSLVLGMNNMEQFEKNMKVVESFSPMAEEEKAELFRTAPELGDYVCRLCGKCVEGGLDPQQVFLLEGLYDRQMDDGRPGDPAHYALRESLRFWFKQNEEAKAEYARLKQKVDPQKDYTRLNSVCPYGIDIDRKLKLAHAKLNEEEYIF